MWTSAFGLQGFLLRLLVSGCRVLGPQRVTRVRGTEYLFGSSVRHSGHEGLRLMLKPSPCQPKSNLHRPRPKWVSAFDRLRVGYLWKGCRESRRFSRDTYPESNITKYTSIRRLNAGFHLSLRFEACLDPTPRPRTHSPPPRATTPTLALRHPRCGRLRTPLHPCFRSHPCEKARSSSEHRRYRGAQLVAKGRRGRPEPGVQLRGCRASDTVRFRDPRVCLSRCLRQSHQRPSGIE